jgi:ABC-type Fe3+/spermidine/putrescine transport system ATPase subunit
VIDARALCARVGTFRLDDVTFAVPAGSYGVVIGPAGSGKTTLLETIAGITPQTGGTLHLDGRLANVLPPEQRGLGLVYQHGYLFPHLSVEQNRPQCPARDRHADRGVGVEGPRRRLAFGW